METTHETNSPEVTPYKQEIKLHKLGFPGCASLLPVCACSNALGLFSTGILIITIKNKKKVTSHRILIAKKIDLDMLLHAFGI